MLPLKVYFKHPKLLGLSLLMKIGFWIPDKRYLQMLYYLKMGKRLNLDRPQSFCEKLQWLKLYDRQLRYTMMVDKLAVKDYVADIIGEKYIIPTIGIWERPEDINFDDLPQQFVLKTTHGGGSGGVVICKDKFALDKNRVINDLKESLRQNIYQKYREWPYKGVKRRIMAEKYLPVATDNELKDYKFYCFDGKPKFCQVIGGRRVKETIDFFDMNWQHQNFYGLNPVARPAIIPPLRPLHFEEMQIIANKLSQDIRFCRIDLYDTLDCPYFGEITFYPASGMGLFTPDEYNYILGEMIHLS